MKGPGPGSGWLSKLETLSILYLAVFLTRIGFGVILILFPLYLPIPKTQSALAAGVTAIYRSSKESQLYPSAPTWTARAEERCSWRDWGSLQSSAFSSDCQTTFC